MKSKPKPYSLFNVILLLILSQPGTESLAILHDNQRPVMKIVDESLYTSCNGNSKIETALLKYKIIASQGGWPAVTKDSSLKKGAKGARVIELRKRLIVTGDLFSDERQEEDAFDEKLHHAVIRFQKRHGLKEDGIVGNETIKSLNVPVEGRIRQIEINLKRLKQMPKSLSERCITVNIAAFELKVFEPEDIVMTMKVIVGKPYWHTPIFSAAMTHLVFNPSWYVPRSISIREILPKIKKEPAYLLKEGFKVFSNNKEVDISAFNWENITADNFKYRFVQIPGSRNPLGRIKFTFLNKFNVYLHDTPARVLFEKSSRAFSHGCIRIEKPIELAEYLLRDDPSWTREKILAAIDKGKEMRVKIPSIINVHILYLTAWVNKDDILHFRNDIYGRDNRP